jgi:hypothetical protein
MNPSADLEARSTVSLAWDFEAQNEDELSAKARATLEVLDNPFPELEWLLVRDPLTQQCGLVPKSYVDLTSSPPEPVPPPPPPQPPPQPTCHGDAGEPEPHVELTKESLVALLADFEDTKARISNLNTCQHVHDIVARLSSQNPPVPPSEPPRPATAAAVSPEQPSSPCPPVHVAEAAVLESLHGTAGMGITPTYTDGETRIASADDEDTGSKIQEADEHDNTDEGRSMRSPGTRAKGVADPSVTAGARHNSTNNGGERSSRTRTDAPGGSLPSVKRATALIKVAVAKDHAKQYKEAYESYAAALDEFVTAIESGEDNDALRHEPALLDRMAGYVRRLCMLEPAVCATLAQQTSSGVVGVIFKPYQNRVRTLRLLVKRGRFDAIAFGEEYRATARARDAEATSASTQHLARGTHAMGQLLQVVLLAYTVALDAFMSVYEERRAIAGTAGARANDSDTLALQKAIVPMLTRAEEVEAMLAALR